MSTCSIRYRLNAPGPSAFIVECNGGMRMYTRGTLGGRMPDGYALALTASRASRWVPASGELILDVELEDEPVSGWDGVMADASHLAPPAALEMGASGSMTA
jgi:hypothetical protein